MTLHITETYKILVEHHGFFFNILEYIRENKDILPNNNVIPKDVYLEEYSIYVENLKIKRNSEAQRIEKALSIENMIYHDFISYENQFQELEYISITEHILQIFQNIYKEYMTPLTDSQYNDFITLMENYKNIFKESTLIKSSILEEQIESLLSLMLKVEDAIKGTYKTLSYKKDHLASNRQSTITTLDKLKEVKKLQKKYIVPIYHFTNNNNRFIKELNELIELLDVRKKLPKLKERLEFYVQLFYIYANRFRPIRIYISKYIEQEEREVLLNVASERRLNEISDLLYHLQKGNASKKYIFNIEGVKDVNLIYENSTSQSFKHKNIKSQKIDIDTYEFYSDYIKEELGKNIHKMKVRFYENENYEYLQEQKSSQMKRQKEFINTVKAYELHMKKHLTDLVKYDMDCSDTILGFLKDREWEIGQFQYLVKDFLTRYDKKYDFYMKKKKTLKHKDIKTEYYGFGISEKLKDN